MNSERSNVEPMEADFQQQQRIAALEERLRVLSGGTVRVVCTRACHPDAFERFLRQVVSYKEREREQVQRLQLLTALPPPETLDDVVLTDQLWREIRRLARAQIYLYHTDHLTDRELYRCLRERAGSGTQAPVPGDAPVRIDFLADLSDATTDLYLQYYADDAERLRWLEDYPTYDLPPKKELPYDRDRHLPRPDW